MRRKDHHAVIRRREMPQRMVILPVLRKEIVIPADDNCILKTATRNTSCHPRGILPCHPRG